MGTELQKRDEFRTKALTPYERPSTESMGKMLAVLKGGYPNQSITPETAQLYLMEFAQIFREVGQEQLEKAIRLAIRESKFFPAIAELRGYLKIAPAINETLVEMRELEERKKAGEKFYGVDDLSKAAQEIFGMKSSRDKDGIEAPAICKAMPNVRTVWPDIDPNRNKAKLDAQAAELLRQTEGK